MTPDELARVPSGGARWEHSEDFDGWFMIIQNDKIIGYGTNAESARQIVGSVNSAIITGILEKQREMLLTQADVDKLEADEKFWLDYSRGGTHD